MQDAGVGSSGNDGPVRGILGAAATNLVEKLRLDLGFAPSGAGAGTVREGLVAGGGVGELRLERGQRPTSCEARNRRVEDVPFVLELDPEGRCDGIAPLGSPKTPTD